MLTFIFTYICIALSFLFYTVTQMPIRCTRKKLSSNLFGNRLYCIIHTHTVICWWDNVLHRTDINHCFQTLFNIFSFTFHCDVAQYSKLSVQFSFLLPLAVSPSGFVGISVNFKGPCEIVIMMCSQRGIFFLAILY